MEMITTVKFTEAEKEQVLNADWGCFSKRNDRRTGQVILELFAHGWAISENVEPAVQYIQSIADSEWGVGEIYDTACWEVLTRFLRNVTQGQFIIIPQ